MTTSDDEVYAYKVFHLKKKIVARRNSWQNDTIHHTERQRWRRKNWVENILHMMMTSREREWREEGMRITCWRVTLSEREREVGGRDEVMKVLRVIVAVSRFVWESWAVESHEHNVRRYQRDKDAIFPLQRWMSSAIIIKNTRSNIRSNQMMIKTSYLGPYMCAERKLSITSETGHGLIKIFVEFIYK